MFQRCNRAGLQLRRLSNRCIAVQRRLPHVSTRRYAAQNSGQGQPTNASKLGPLSGLASEVDKIAPRFEIDASDIQILKEPEEFYEVLKAKILGAKRRVFLSTLYVGKAEHELIDTIRQALRNNENLKVSILTDYLRGTREDPQPSCTSLLAPLISEFGPDRVEIRLFHTPNLVGFKKRVLPKRINEGWGLQHMKLYGMDDEIIISGANLSSDYFTNRQDRYHLFQSAELTKYYARIHDAVCSISFSVKPVDHESNGFEAVWPFFNSAPNPLEHPDGYRQCAGRLLKPFIDSMSRHSIQSALETKTPTSAADATDTIVYPVFQLTPLFAVADGSPDASTELPFLNTLLARLQSPPLFPAKWTFTAGYFNMTDGMRDMLLSTLRSSPATQKSASSEGTIITAHPHANGFYGSRGVSGMLPPAYTLLARRFMQQVRNQELESSITLKEWKNGVVGEPEGWSYHAKGIWVTLPTAAAAGAASRWEDGPSITLVGSSNYTRRSHKLDLEANALILTRNQDLQRRLHAEEQYLQTYASQVGPDEFARTERRVSLMVRISLWIVGLVGGAL